MELGKVRRALAARRHVAAQFLIESLLLATLGAAVGITLGAATTYALALHRGWQPLIPGAALATALAAALLIGTTAGLHPAHRAARLAPTDALRAS